MFRGELQYITKKETHPQGHEIEGSIFTLFFVYCIYTMSTTPLTNTTEENSTRTLQNPYTQTSLQETPTGAFGTFMTVPLRINTIASNSPTYIEKSTSPKPLGQEIVSTKDKRITQLEEELNGKTNEIRTLRDALLLENERQKEIDTLRNQIEKIRSDLLLLDISLSENDDGTFSLVDNRARRSGNANEAMVIHALQRTVLRAIPPLTKRNAELPKRKVVKTTGDIAPAQTPDEEIKTLGVIAIRPEMSDDSQESILLSHALDIEPVVMLAGKAIEKEDTKVDKIGGETNNEIKSDIDEDTHSAIEIGEVAQTAALTDTTSQENIPATPPLEAPFVESIKEISTPPLEKKSLPYTEARELTDILFETTGVVTRDMVMSWLSDNFEYIQTKSTDITPDISHTAHVTEETVRHNTMSVLSEESKEVLSFAGAEYEEYVTPFFMKLNLSEQELLSLATHFGAVTIQDIYFSKKESATNIAISKGTIISVKVPLSACVYQISQLCTRLGAPIEFAQKEIKDMTLHQFFVHAKNVVKERWDTMEKEKYMTSQAANDETFTVDQAA